MISNGYRVYRDKYGELRVDGIVEGMVYEFEPLPEDEELALGYYDVDWKLVEAEEE